MDVHGQGATSITGSLPSPGNRTSLPWPGRHRQARGRTATRSRTRSWTASGPAGGGPTPPG